MLWSTDLVREAINVVSPITCAGCGRPDEVCCVRCRGRLAPHPHEPSLALRRALFGVPVVAGLVNQGVVSRVIRAYKDQGVSSLARHLAPALRVAMAACLRRAGVAEVEWVAVPHSSRRWRTTGRKPNELLLSVALRDPHRRARVRLGVSGTTPLRPTQKSLTREQRLAEPPRFAVARTTLWRPVILVDDVVTTGISLEYAARALESAGVPIVGCVVLAATPPPGPARWVG